MLTRTVKNSENEQCSQSGINTKKNTDANFAVQFNDNRAHNQQNVQLQAMTRRHTHRNVVSVVDERPEMLSQAKLKQASTNSNQNRPLAQLHRSDPHQAGKQKKSVQTKANTKGLPDNLKSGIENLSGYAMDDVKVHYNSDKPAQLQAHAYAQGNHIHLARGQERHLPHEAWHVVQQKQGRVKPTLQLQKDAPSNLTEWYNRSDFVAQCAMQNKNDTTDLSPANGVFQLLTIDDKKITKSGGKSGKWLLGILKQKLYDMGLSPHGVTGYLNNTLYKKGDTMDEGTFIAWFEQQAQAESERVQQAKKARKKGEPRVQSWTRPLNLSRPAWTVEHKQMSEDGQDIRHIVRNYTMKNAIYGEWNHQKGLSNEGVFNDIADALGAEKGSHPWEAMKNVYTRAYLNKINLFGGGSGVNRVIGLLADNLIHLGDEVAGWTTQPDKAEVTKLYQNVLHMVETQMDSTWDQGEFSKDSDAFQEGMEEHHEIVSNYLEDLYSNWLGDVEDGETEGLYNKIGHEISEIGVNFGFDIPAESNPERLAMLLHVEEGLGTYQVGNPGALTAILKQFLGIDS